MRRYAWLLTVLLALSTDGWAEEYEIGGPLAGVRLPLAPTQHGEPPGYPGCIPELMASGEAVQDMGHRYREWGPQGQSPEWNLYEGSVERWRAYMQKYLPIRSFFDRQSQLKNFVAPQIPGARPEDIQRYAAPIYWVPRHAPPRPTGRFAQAVPVVRMTVDGPELDLDPGRLDRGLYVVRIIGAVRTEQLRPFRQPLFMRMAVNDGAEGGTSRYRLRLGYCDEFYSVAEFYFHAPESRRYRATLAVDRGSQVELLVHNVSLDDVLAGTLRRPIKTQAISDTGLAPSPTTRLSRQERLERDAAIWNAFPPVNAQGSTIGAGYGGYGSIAGVRAGSDQLTGEEIHQRYGRWVPPDQAGPMQGRPDWRPETVFLANPKLNLVHTIQDLRTGRALPDPYPFKDDGAGLYFPDPDHPDRGAVWTPIGNRVHQLYRQYYLDVGRFLDRYRRTGNPEDAHDAAITLIRFAYAFPTLDPSEYLSNTVHDPGPFGRDASCRRRFTAAYFLPHYAQYVKPIMFHYDELFPLIRSNRLLAESVGRFVPWVRSPEDLVELIDVYLVQTTAKRIMRYHYHTDVVDIANLAAVAGNRQVTDPWMEWLFSRTFIYPLPVAGVQDVMISGCTREGTEVVGSTYYAQQEGAARVAAALDLYLKAGGNPRFDLSDRRRYPKPVAHAYWRLENVVGGGDFLRIGDVCGPDKAPGHTLRDLGFARHGWRWTRDPRFAFILRHYVGRSDQSDAEWAEIERAAGRQRRAPWLENRSRVMPMWAAVLETGHQHDDSRFRRAAYVRLGFGTGHQHYDTLDLQLVAHGLPFTVDGGQRPGYSVPGDRTTRVHNLVQVDGHPAYRHSWATALADCPGSRFLEVDADPPPGVGLLRRQVALIDVDEGRGSQRLPPERQRPGAPLPRGVQTPNSYVFDVFRVGAGHQHTYCFHGAINDEFTWNATDAAPPDPGSEEATYLSRFRLMPEANQAGDCPAVLVATWRMAREVDGPGAGEKEMLGQNYDPAAPRKFTRLHLLATDGLRALRGESVCRQWNYHLTNLMVRTARSEEPRPQVFAAVIQPYVGRPFLKRIRLLAVEDNDSDAQRVVAVAIQTHDGRQDLCFADGRPEKRRRVPEAQLVVAGQFAFYSIDQEGLRQAALVGGHSLRGPLVRITTACARRSGVVRRVDYGRRSVWIDQSWPARSTPCLLETGAAGHWTSYTALSVQPTEGGSRLELQRGADSFRSQITAVDSDRSTVTTALRPLVEQLDHNRTGWVASDERQRTFWRATYLGAGTFRLEGPPVTHAAFEPEGVLRLWEIGVGDQVRTVTAVVIRRIEPGRFEVLSDVEVALALPGHTLEISTDGTTWTDAGTSTEGGWVRVNLPPDDQPRQLRCWATPRR